MKKILLIALVICFQSAFAQTNNDWENPQLIDQNKEKPHTSFMLYDKKEDAVVDNFEKSSYYQSLNGVWNFFYVHKYAQRDRDFYRTDLNGSKWSAIDVPSNWEIGTVA